MTIEDTLKVFIKRGSLTGFGVFSGDLTDAFFV